METLLLVLFPSIAATLLLLLTGKNLKLAAIVAALTELALGLYMAAGFTPGQGDQYVFKAPWIGALGINFSFAVDGLSMLLILLTVILVPIIILSTFSYKEDKPCTFYAMILFMQTGLLGVFTARDALLFYLFWEAALIPVYFLAGVWAGERKIGVTFKFFIYTVFGSLLMLAGLIFIYVHTNGGDGAMFSAAMVDMWASAARMVPENQAVVFWLLFAAFAIKMPIFPFHTWQPDTYAESPTAATMLLSGIMLKMGIYGLLRWLLPMVPMGVMQFSDFVVVLCVIGIVYGAVIAVQQQDMKRLLAYSSFSHVGLMGAAIFAGTVSGVQGAVIQMLAHGVSVVGLFAIVEMIQQRTGYRELESLGGLTQKSPSLTVYFMILLLGAVALPLTSGFIGEFMMLAGLYQYNVIVAIIAGSTIIFGAVYMLRMYQKAMFGPLKPELESFTDLTVTEHLTLIPLVVLTFWIGLYPSTFLQITEPEVVRLLQSMTINR